MSETAMLLMRRPAELSTLVEEQQQRSTKKVGQQRRYAPKTRTGCLTCKIRRIKCDEAKPACTRCTSTGRKCDGYLDLHQVANKSPEPLTVALSADLSSDALDRRAFDFFRCRTAPVLAGYFSDASWDRLVLQLSHSEAAIRHAANALGAIHEEHTHRAGVQDQDALTQPGFAVQQYAKALREMQTLLKEKTIDLDIILLCSLLCAHFESLRECFVPALLHAENAISLLHSQNAKFDARKVNPSLVRAMMRMDLQGTMLLGMRTPGMTFYTEAMDSVLPNSFHDLTQARDLIHSWTCRLYHFMRTTADAYKFRSIGDIPIEEYAKAQDLQATMLQLENLLWDYMHKPSAKLTMREQHGLAMLRSRIKVNKILSACCLTSEACVYDKFLLEFEEIMTNCLFITSSDQPERRLLSVSLDEGLIHPLFFTATHCRDSRIRHQALETMKRMRVGDGGWHIETTIATVELCIDYEESRCAKDSPKCEDIPEFWRVHSAAFDGWMMEGPRRSVSVHFRTKPNGVDGEWTDVTQSINCPDRSDAMDDLLRIRNEGPELSSRIKCGNLISWP